MSFRLFIYYCALCGGWAALGGWMLGRMAISNRLSDRTIVGAGLKGLCLGLLVALAVSLVDALNNFSPRQITQWIPNVFTAVVIGTMGGLFGGIVGQALFDLCRFNLFLVLGWTITGLLIGVSLGVFDLLYCQFQQRNVSSAWRKMVKGIVGGTVGGCLGGFLSLVLHGVWSIVFRHSEDNQLLWSPSATGFVVLGACIGLFIGLAQVILKEAWIHVESGQRSGRELILAKPEITLGRAESCDIGLFGDTGVERLHARILQLGDCYFLDDAGTSNGTFVNGERIHQRTPLHSGDGIRLGNYVLRFRERRKKSEKA